MKRTKGVKSEDQKGTAGKQTNSLNPAQRHALNMTAVALQSATEFHKWALETNQPNPGNIEDAKESLSDAMVNLAIAASTGQGFKRIKAILSDYGLEDLF